VTLNTGTSETTQVSNAQNTTAPFNLSTAGVSIRQQIYNFGRTADDVAAADAAADASRCQASVRRVDIAYGVRKAFGDWLRARGLQTQAEARQAAASLLALVRQNYPLPNPNRPRTHSAAPCHAAPTLGPLLGPSRRPRGQEQSACYLQDLGPLMALPSKLGASHVRVDLQNSKPFGPLVGSGGAPGAQNGALACARCTFHLKMMLPPQRGSHFFIGHVMRTILGHQN
jgi:hypothetical protein